jgi:hypothetical protein
MSRKEEHCDKENAPYGSAYGSECTREGEFSTEPRHATDYRLIWQIRRLLVRLRSLREWDWRRLVEVLRTTSPCSEFIAFEAGHDAALF